MQKAGKSTPDGGLDMTLKLFLLLLTERLPHRCHPGCLLWLSVTEDIITYTSARADIHATLQYMMPWLIFRLSLTLPFLLLRTIGPHSTYILSPLHVKPPLACFGKAA